MSFPCPKCHQNAPVLHTRKHDGFTKRRHQCEKHGRFTTHETKAGTQIVNARPGRIEGKPQRPRQSLTHFVRSSQGWLSPMFPSAVS